MSTFLESIVRAQTILSMFERHAMMNCNYPGSEKLRLPEALQKFMFVRGTQGSQRS